jgi:hypothetical protein
MRVTRTFFNTPLLLSIARKSYEAIASEPPNASRTPEPIHTIVFAAIGLEALVNEVGESASDPTFHDSRVQPPIKDVAAVFAEAEAGRAQLPLKLQVLSLALARRTLDRGERLFQELALLVDLRNSLVHLKLDQTTFPVPPDHEPRILKRLRSTGILADVPTPPRPSWPILVSTPAAAKWAFNTAVGTGAALLDLVPPSLFRETLDLHFRPALQPLT